MFTPENELEQAMLRAAAGSSETPDFFRQLLESDLVLLGSKSERLAIDVVKHGSGFFHPLFTSPARLEAFSAEELPNFQMPGRALFEATRGAQFIVNPRSSPAKTLFPDEIEWCLENFRAISLAILEPKTYPTQLVKALCVLFTSRTQVQTARLAHVATQGVESDAHIVIGIEAGGDIPRLAQEIFTAAAMANPSLPVDVTHIDIQSQKHPLQKHLLTVQPFFERVSSSMAVC